MTILAAVTMLMFSKAVYASEKTVTQPGEAVREGKYIYYAYEMSGIRMGSVS